MTNNVFYLDEKDLVNDCFNNFDKQCLLHLITKKHEHLRQVAMIERIHNKR